MTSKNSSWRHQYEMFCHDVKNTSCHQKVSHDVKNTKKEDKKKNKQVRIYDKPNLTKSSSVKHALRSQQCQLVILFEKLCHNIKKNVNMSNIMESTSRRQSVCQKPNMWKSQKVCHDVNK